MAFKLSDSVGNSKIKEVTRWLFTGPGTEPPGYGLYSYLLFGSSSEAGRSKRYAAARAYCQNFAPLEDALRMGYKPINLNVFLVPLSAMTPSDTYCKADELLVDDYYNYVSANNMLESIGVESDGVYLIACDTPISKCDRARMLTVDLTTVDVHLVELSVLEFRRQTRKEEYWDDNSLRNLVLTLRLKLPAIKVFISFATAAAKER
jgi:hypothetical protein